MRLLDLQLVGRALTLGQWYSNFKALTEYG